MGTVSIVTWQELLASLVDSLAWPVFSVIAVLLARKPLAKALRERDLKSFSAGPTGVTVELWERRLEQTRESIALEPAPEQDSEGPQEARSDFEEDMLGLALDFPEAAVVESFRRLERLLVAALGGPYAKPVRLTPAQATRAGAPDIRLLVTTATLNELLTEAEGDAVMALRNLRNAAAHSHSVEIDSEAALDYIDSIAQIASKVRKRANEAGFPLPPL